MFAECTPNATKELIEIFQENGEVVCCIGSALNFKNISSFAIADISISVAPLHTKQQTKSKNSILKQSPLTYGAEFASIPCSLFMNSDSSLYILTQIIRESREIQISLINAFFLLIGSLLTLCVMYLLSAVLILPPIYQAYHVFWLSWIFLPIISATLLSTPHDSLTMTLMPAKNQNHIKNKKKYYLFFFFRFILIILMLVFAFIVILDEMLLEENEEFLINKYYDVYRKSYLDWDKKAIDILKYAQAIVILLFTYYIVCVSSTFISRIESIFKFSPFHNHKWCLISLGMLILQIIITLIFLDTFEGFENSLKKISWYNIVLFLVWPIIFIPVQEIVKQVDKKEYMRFQKRTKLEFNTKLGMHSPL